MAVAYLATTVGTNSASSATAVLNTSARSVGDYALVMISRTAVVAPTGVPSGWTLLHDHLSTYGIWLYGKVLASGDITTTLTWTWAAGTKTLMKGVFYSGVDTTTPVESSSEGTYATTSLQTLNLGSVTTSELWIVALASCYSISSKTWNISGQGLTERHDYGSTSPDFWQYNGDTNGAHGGGTLAPSTSTGYISANASYRGGFLVVLNEATGGTQTADANFVSRTAGTFTASAQNQLQVADANMVSRTPVAHSAAGAPQLVTASANYEVRTPAIFSADGVDMSAVYATPELVGYNTNSWDNVTAGQVALPSGWQVGDIAVMTLYCRDSAKTFSMDNAQWYAVRNSGTTDYGRIYTAVTKLVATNSMWFTGNSLVDQSSIGMLTVWRGVQLRTSGWNDAVNSDTGADPAAPNLTAGSVDAQNFILCTVGQRTLATYGDCSNPHDMVGWATRDSTYDVSIFTAWDIAQSSGAAFTTDSTGNSRGNSLELEAVRAANANRVTSAPTVHQATGQPQLVTATANFVSHPASTFQPTGVKETYLANANFVSHPAATYNAEGVTLSFPQQADANFVAHPASTFQATGLPQLATAVANLVPRTASTWQATGLPQLVTATALAATRTFSTFSATGLPQLATAIANYAAHPATIFAADGIRILRTATANYVPRTATVLTADGIKLVYVSLANYVSRTPVVHQASTLATAYALAASRSAATYNAQGLPQLATSVAQLVQSTPTVYSADGIDEANPLQIAGANYVERTATVHQATGAPQLATAVAKFVGHPSKVGLVGEFVAALAKNGTAPGNNTDPTTSFENLVGPTDGTLSGFAYTEASGWAGSGTESDPYRLVFDGSGDYVTVANENSMVEPHTWEGWFKLPGAYVPVWLWSYGGAGAAPGFTITDSWAGTAVPLLLMGNSNYRYWWGVDVGDGEWHHFAVQIDGGSDIGDISSSVLWLDGVQQTAKYTITADVPATVANPLRLSPASSVAHAMLRVYHRLLTADEVLRNFNAGPQAATPRLYLPTTVQTAHAAYVSHPSQAFQPTGQPQLVTAQANYVSHPSQVYTASAEVNLQTASANFVAHPSSVSQATGVRLTTAANANLVEHPASVFQATGQSMLQLASANLVSRTATPLPATGLPQLKTAIANYASRTATVYTATGVKLVRVAEASLVDHPPQTWGGDGVRLVYTAAAQLVTNGSVVYSPRMVELEVGMANYLSHPPVIYQATGVPWARPIVSTLGSTIEKTIMKPIPLGDTDIDKTITKPIPPKDMELVTRLRGG